MKRFYIIMTTVTFIFICIFSFNKIKSAENTANALKVSSKYTVIIDAGHGGKDAGTTGIDNTPEKKINLEIALRLRDFLEVSGINCVLIREHDNEFYPEGTNTNRSDLYNRLDFVNSVPDSVLISIHQNHYENEAEWGTQIWYSANTPESKVLADGVLNAVKEFLQPDNKRENKVSDSSYYLLYKASVPSIMIECGFMSNRKENNKLQDPDYQNDMAFSILTGICTEV